MNKLIFILIIILFFASFTTISANYRMPFPDNLALEFSQTWHSSGSYYAFNGSTYSWTSGNDYAVDIAPVDGGDTIIKSPGSGVVKYIEKCAESGNIVIELNGYEMQFYHLDTDDIYVDSNDIITKGQDIGRLYDGGFEDNCGHSYGTHLHLRFETKHGSNDSEPVIISGYEFDEYDCGASSCIMHRIENGQNVTYCYDYSNPSIFTANEPFGPANSCSGQSNMIISTTKNNLICGVSNLIYLSPNAKITGESRLYIN